MNNKFSENLSQLVRLKTQNVKVGDVFIGNGYPIRTQSMTNTLTSDIDATVKQCLEIAEAGADIVRVTAPTIQDAEKLKIIKNKLLQQGYNIPLVADVHFNPAIANIAAKYVDKVRINPGNYIDKKTSKTEYTEQEYNTELKKLENKFTEFLDICKKNNTAIRIGSNHGSLSTRIMFRYGDTAQGMVESAMEFLRICKKQNFYNVIISMKSSNVRVMVYAYRLLVKQMFDEKIMFPLHLGVTEAGDGIDGRVKSAIGIGTLLNDGIGDTIRVSLTEPPQDEIPVCNSIINYFNEKLNCNSKVKLPDNINFIFFDYSKIFTNNVSDIGNKNKPVVIADMSDNKNIDLHDVGYLIKDNIITKTPLSADYIFLGNNIPDDLPPNVNFICNAELFNNKKNIYPYFKLSDFKTSEKKSEKLNFVEISYNDINDNFFEDTKIYENVVFVLTSEKTNSFFEKRAVLLSFYNKKIQNPIIIKQVYDENSLQELTIKSSFDNGGFFIDGFGDGIFISNKNREIKKSEINKISFSILQASRVRTSKPDYISCPSCGRTLFDLQTTTQKIKQVTGHLAGIKIGIMGCIVNGIGEMADADYGYVGAGKGKISLYKNKEIIKRNIPEENAVEELINLIKENGDWKEKNEI